MREFASKARNVGYFEITPYLCPQGRCWLLDRNGVPYYRDCSHLSQKGSLRLGHFILDSSGVPDAFSQIARIPPRE